MHELAIAESVIDTITARVGDRRVSSVLLEVGRLSGVSSDALRFSFELAAQGTGVDGAQLEINEPAGRARCAQCDRDFEVNDLIMLCSCGSSDVRLLAGDELRIISVAVKR